MYQINSNLIKLHIYSDCIHNIDVYIQCFVSSVVLYHGYYVEAKERQYSFDKLTQIIHTRLTHTCRFCLFFWLWVLRCWCMRYCFWFCFWFCYLLWVGSKCVFLLLFIKFCNLFNSTYSISYDPLSVFSLPISPFWEHPLIGLLLYRYNQYFGDSVGVGGLLHVGYSVYLWFTYYL